MSVISSFEVKAYTDSLNALTGVAKSAVENAISGIEYEDVADLRAKLFDAIEPFVTASTDTAASLAAEFYDSVREQATGARYGANPVSNHEPQATEGAIRAFLQGVVDGKGLGDIMDLILGRVDWEVKHAAGECVIENAMSDPLCKRYARVPTGAETCPFCLMLASRGFVYLNAKSAGADEKRGHIAGRDGHYHANCDCRIVPGFDGMEYEGYDPDGLLVTFLELSEGFDDRKAVEEWNSYDADWQKENPWNEFKTRKLMAYVRANMKTKDPA